MVLIKRNYTSPDEKLHVVVYESSTRAAQPSPAGGWRPGDGVSSPSAPRTPRCTLAVTRERASDDLKIFFFKKDLIFALWLYNRASPSPALHPKNPASISIRRLHPLFFVRVVFHPSGWKYLLQTLNELIFPREKKKIKKNKNPVKYVLKRKFSEGFTTGKVKIVAQLSCQLAGGGSGSCGSATQQPGNSAAASFNLKRESLEEWGKEQLRSGCVLF